MDSDRVGFAGEKQSLESARVREVVDRQLRRHFPPEFLNRLDDVIVFDPLSEESMLRVAEILLDETADNLGRQRITLTYDEAVPAWLMSRCSVDPQAGARPLRRLVKLWVEDAVADFLILNRGGDEVTLNVALRDDEPVVEETDAVPQGEERR